MKLKVMFLICLICSIIGCADSYCDLGLASECGEGVKYPAYINESGVMIKIVAVLDDYPRYEKIVANGDTLHNNYEHEEENVLWELDCYYQYCRDNPIEIKVELHFLDDPQKCLIFDGLVKNDGIDIRSLESYEKGEYFGGGPLLDVEYVYTITPEHRAMAREEDCL